MIKVGFIDYYLDEWHANNYPKFLKEQSDGEMEVCCAYGKIDSPIGGMTNKQWSQKYNIPLAGSIKEVIEKSDVLVVLSPDNPEMHEELCDEAVKSKKRVYIDKTFAPTREAAGRIFKKAEEYGTPCYSSSALGFSSELDEIDVSKIDCIYSAGYGKFEIYVIHQIEPVVRLMGCKAKRVMYTADLKHPAAVVEFSDGRIWHIAFRDDSGASFRYVLLDKDNAAKIIDVRSDYFGLFIKAMVNFFRSGKIPVEHERTIEVIAIREALIKARKTPFEWVEL